MLDGPRDGRLEIRRRVGWDRWQVQVAISQARSLRRALNRPKNFHSPY
jgi:hypothetical protein